MGLQPDSTSDTTPSRRPATHRIAEPAGIGASAGIAGFAGEFAWLHRHSTRTAIDGVRPGTLRGAVNVVGWFAVLIAIGVVGRLVIPELGIGWLLIGLAVMVPVAMWWPTRHRAPD